MFKGKDRSVISQGINSLSCTLPKKWCEKNEVKKGGKLTTFIGENMIIIMPNSCGKLPKMFKMEVG